MTICSRCMIDAGHGVDMDSFGICSYCRLIEGFPWIISRIGSSEDVLSQRLGLFQDQGKYDCIVGLSGGKDSSYIVYLLKTKYNARVLTFTLDNGFLTGYARDNIESIVRGFCVDHIWVRPEKDIQRRLYAVNLNKECWPCSACVHMGETSIWKLAYEHRVPFIISGRTPEQILRRPSRELMRQEDSLLFDNFSGYDRGRVLKMAVQTLQRIKLEKRWLFGDHEKPLQENISLYPTDNTIASDDFAPEYLAFFLYEKHDEIKMMETLERNTSWRNPEKKGLLSHLDCTAHDAAGYLYYRRHKVPFIGLEISALVRLNQMSKEQARGIYLDEIDSLSAYPEESINALASVSGISPHEIRMLPEKIRIKRYVKDRIKKIVGR